MISPAARGQKSGGVVAPSEPRFKMLRSISGPSGSQQNGRYVVADPRSIFYLPADKQVIVYFDWEGPVGKHHFEGYWKNPAGKITSIADFDYETKQPRFGVYWQIDLTPNIVPGMWTLEAHIDGENSGSHSFQVIAAEKPEGAAPQRHLLQTSEIYQKALSSMVLIEALSANGQRIGSGLGFTLEEGTIVTAFQVIDGAAQLRIVLPSGQQGTTDQVVAWNRLQDWALLKADTGSLSKLPRATEELAVGDRCFSFEMAAGEARTIVEQQITGKSVHAEMGARLNLLQFASPAAMGSPVLNEYGEVVAILGGNTYPGLHRGSQGADAAIVPGLYRGAMATPIAMVTPLPSSAVKSLAELAAAGQFVPPVQPRPELVYGMIGAHFEHGKSAFQASRQSKTDLSRAADRVCSVALEWNPRAKIKTQVMVALYDLENHLLAKSAPVKVNLGSGQYATTFVDFPLSALKPGYYRAEAQQENVPIWRAYFKVSE